MNKSIIIRKVNANLFKFFGAAGHETWTLFALRFYCYYCIVYIVHIQTRIYRYIYVYE